MDTPQPKRTRGRYTAALYDAQDAIGAARPVRIAAELAAAHAARPWPDSLTWPDPIGLARDLVIRLLADVFVSVPDNPAQDRADADALRMLATTMRTEARALEAGVLDPKPHRTAADAIDGLAGVLDLIAAERAAGTGKAPRGPRRRLSTDGRGLAEVSTLETRKAAVAQARAMGNVSAAARELGMHKSTLHDWVKADGGLHLRNGPERFDDQRTPKRRPDSPDDSNSGR